MKKKFAAVAFILLATAIAVWQLHRPAIHDTTLTLYGNVDVRQIALAFEGAGRLATLAAQEGDHVQAGQILATLDARTLELEIVQAEAERQVSVQTLQKLRNGSRPQEIAQARANVTSAEADALNARQQLIRMQAANGGTSGFAVSSQDLDSATARLNVAQARLDNVRKALELAQIGPRREEISEAQARVAALAARINLLQHQRDQTQLKAPVAAVVRSRLFEPGEMVSPQKPVLALAITHPKWIRAYVSEAQLGRIQPGMAVQIHTDSLADLTGRVGYIASVAEFTPKTVQTEELRTSLVYEVRIEVEDAQDQLRLGMPATVRIASKDSQP